MNLIRAYWEKFRDYYSQLERRQRIILVVGAVCVCAIVFGAFAIINNVQYGVLFAGLENGEAGAIVEKLKEENVSYRLENGGSTIHVPSHRIYDLRLQLAAQGLPQNGGVGYEIFDRNNIGTTDFVQKVNYRRALEGELARTISFMASVKSARVHLVVPEERLFEEDRKEPTASITLRMSPGRTLSHIETQSIANLVAASVEGLSTHNVTVVDTNGNILSKPQKSNSIFAMTSDQVEMKHSIESYYHDKVEEILESVVGRDRTAVQVSVELNFDQVNRTIEQYDPDNTVIISQERSSQTAQADAQGVDPDRTTNQVTNYQSNRTVDQIVREVGNIKRLSVAVMVDGKPQPGAAPGDPATVVPLTPAELNQLTDVVQKTVGFDPARQDEVVVVNMPFDRTAEATELQALDQLETQIFWQTWIARVVYGVVVLAIGFLLWKFSRSFKGVLTPGGMPSLSLDAGKGGDPVNFELSSDIKNSARLQQTISTLTKEKPDDAAKLLKAWLVED